jgi:ketosteroid isomerase-like protein
VSDLEANKRTVHAFFQAWNDRDFKTTAEADRVVVIAESHGTHKSGRAYNNHYSFHIRVVENRIARVREFFDTEHATWVETGRTGQDSASD